MTQGRNIAALERAAQQIEKEFEDVPTGMYAPLHATRRFYHTMLLKLAANVSAAEWDRATTAAREQLRRPV